MDFTLLKDIQATDLEVIKQKNADYGGSWKARGGPGAYMMMAIKWDRIETIVRRHNWDVFTAGVNDAAGVCDNLQDLSNYLLLIRGEIQRLRETEEEDV